MTAAGDDGDYGSYRSICSHVTESSGFHSTLLAHFTYGRCRSAETNKSATADDADLVGDKSDPLGLASQPFLRERDKVDEDDGRLRAWNELDQFWVQRRRSGSVYSSPSN